jgi:hypothetical protein
MLKVKFTGNAKSQLEQIRRELKSKRLKMNRSYGKANQIAVGLNEDAHDYPAIERGDETVVQTSPIFIGALHEYGIGRLPKRPWMSLSFEKDKAWVEDELNIVVKKWVEDEASLTGELIGLGIKARQSMKKHINENDIGLLKNAKSTIRRKGGSTPMVNTSHLVNEIDFKIGKDILE